MGAFEGPDSRYCGFDRLQVAALRRATVSGPQELSFNDPTTNNPIVAPSEAVDEISTRLNGNVEVRMPTTCSWLDRPPGVCHRRSCCRCCGSPNPSERVDGLSGAGKRRAAQGRPSCSRTSAAGKAQCDGRIIFHPATISATIFPSLAVLTGIGQRCGVRKLLLFKPTRHLSSLTGRLVSELTL